MQKNNKKCINWC